MRNIDFTSWQSIRATLIGLALVTLIGVGIRLLMMVTIQQRRERLNRQINERLKTLIAAYKTLGGSFTGTLSVDPAHLRDLRRRKMSRQTKRKTILPKDRIGPGGPAMRSISTPFRTIWPFPYKGRFARRVRLRGARGMVAKAVAPRVVVGAAAVWGWRCRDRVGPRLGGRCWKRR